MKKSKLYFAAGTFILGIATIFAVKASKRFSTGFTTVVVTYGNYTITITYNNQIFTTVSNGPLFSKQLYADFYTSATGTIPGSSAVAHGPLLVGGKPTYIK